ncbi:uncharacterized protein LOC131806860 [Musca domestica]|uniref:Uncharacterized protein LOC131800827 n=3 Tax=Musca TaxID=7369 RepID=A0ABM3V0A2_MUSDO|nr:uncharacterized protein LOC131800827 [Musca domestica]XP_058975957.1 uncharacterized protein LOC131801374 [Musca domestica]XP_058975964.1 uncharacterized protein LOC131801374 [Musca domestica]XP_058976733.1 uncharacterized protein LOC131801796 [Musca domestica]XP_058976734.1 uncharacterized protein LOC131801796 [Musca domestica]XP_058978157.1 uncharacterized protein LOC131802259 [Musca domestica]XP_058978158.1 uncharacterized protein LOC131802259 [Musca domestica]XP_058978412.1 uncharacte
MSNENANPSKGKMKYFAPQANAKCSSCQENARKLDTIIDILAEHKVLLDRVISQNAFVDNIMTIFPIESEEKLREFDRILATQADLYTRQMKNLIAGNAERNLHKVFGRNIIMDFNVDGTFGKKGLRDFGNVLAAIIEVISTFNKLPDKTLRAAFQRQKKKYFKINKRSRRTEEKEQDENDEEPQI